MEKREFLLPDFTQLQINILQLLFEKQRKTAIVNEFIITSKEEILCYLELDPNIVEVIKKEFELFCTPMAESTISQAIIAILYIINIVEDEALMLIGFGGMNAAKGIYKQDNCG